MTLHEYTTPEGITSKVIEDSISTDGIRLTTLQLKYPRFIHAEFMTHRMFSRNASSSRAIPVQKIMDDVRRDPAVPVYWGSNKPGMQAGDQVENIGGAREAWENAANSAVEYAQALNDIGLHKQIVNRVMEPWHFIHVVVTATEWENFYSLRIHPDAQPEIHALAKVMFSSMESSEPTVLNPGQWHLPYVSRDELYDYGIVRARSASVARCARVSYKNHDQSDPNIDKDISLAEMLMKSGHWSPFEHQASPMTIPKWNLMDAGDGLCNPEEGVSHIDIYGNAWSGNFRGWTQLRRILDV